MVTCMIPPPTNCIQTTTLRLYTLVYGVGMEPRTTIDDDEVGSTPGTGRPTGRAGARNAVPLAARAQVAARGPRVARSGTAEAAGVNRGAIHRPVGRKEHRLSEVLDDGRRDGTAQIDGVDDAGRALRTALLGASARPDCSRLLLWLAPAPEAVPP